MKSHIHSFIVEDLSSLSDHRPLSLQIKYTKSQEDHLRIPILLPKPTRIQIKNIETYQKELDNEMNVNTISLMIEKLNKCNSSEELNRLTQSTANLYINAAKQSRHKCCPKHKTPNQQKTKKTCK